MDSKDQPKVEAPTVEPPLAEDELAEKLSSFSPAERSNLSILYALFVQGETQLWQEKKLRDAGIIGGKSELPPQCSARELARILTAEYGNKFNKTFYAKEILEDWVRKKGMREPGENSLFNTREALQWVKDNIIEGTVGGEGAPATGTVAAGEAAKNRRQVILEERDRFLLDLEKKKAAGELVSRREAEIACIGLAKRFLSITRDEIRGAFLKIDVTRGEELIDALDKKYKEAAHEAETIDADYE